MARFNLDTRRHICHAELMVKNIRLMTVVLFGLLASLALAAERVEDIEAAREAIAQQSADLDVLLVEEHYQDDEQVNQVVVGADGSFARRIFSLGVLERSGLFDSKEAKEDWRTVAADFVFFDGEGTMIRSGGFDRYIEEHIDALPQPWGADPMHSCVWPMIASWVRDGELIALGEGGWLLRVRGRNLTIEFDEELRVRTVEHKYDMATGIRALGLHGIWRRRASAGETYRRDKVLRQCRRRNPRSAS